MALPVAYLLVRASSLGVAGFLETALEARTLGLLARTALLAAAVTATAVAIAVPLAWITTRTDLPGRRVWTVLLALPLVVPSYLGAYAFVAAFGPFGMAQEWLAALGVERLPSIYGFGGAWLVLSLFTYPYVFLIVRAAIRGLDPALEDASLGLGRGRRETFRRVVAPQLRPAVVAGSLLVALYTLHDFGAVSLLRFDSFTRGIYLRYQASFDRSRAAVLALLLVVLALAILALEARARGRAAYHSRASGGRRRAPVAPLGRLRIPAIAMCTVVVLLGLGVPLTVVGVWLARGVAGGEPVHAAFAAAGNSLRASALGALVAVVAAWPVAVLGARHRSAGARAAERLAYASYALPGIVVALALVFFGARYAPALYQTVPMLALAYAVLFLPQAGGAMRASLLQFDPHVEESARSLGSGRARTTLRIVAPLVRPGVAAGFALVLLTAMKELPATLLLAPAGFSSLATEVWSATNAAAYGRAALPALLLIALASAPLSVLLLSERGATRVREAS